ncbi:Succinate dehydrogenase assembly factor 1, mitochondrial [Zancudomyces culisetae]|uniref:Succinate dehydrogenase assembly factor 1, mitochondrial n=1 Tax=Zancudomyces culisetae TaxID=1213189 RepID=A0A1R1PNY2_ZANCU|nr:Succinate dehydrogenase assembly factor 1, mitochondrial [Zancudomyces culisetae]|eukprot:OMH82668.1 Succinate dehydrogenase assembly factor 1, mitochondrial [Zancudomyces culisetae]
MAQRHYSGLQKEVLALYRNCIRSAQRVESVELRTKLTDRVRMEFRKNLGIKRGEIDAIGYLLRMGKRKYEKYIQSGSITNITTMK